LLVGWTLDLPASADVLIRIDKEKAVSRHDLPPTLFIARPANSPPLATGTEPLGEAEPLLTNNSIWQEENSSIRISLLWLML
jgi:hypothetical protein